MVSLHYLKNAFDESDESVVDRFLENPYWQYFCGRECFEHELPLDPTSLVKWRHRVGEEGMESPPQETLETAKRGKLIKRVHLRRVNADTTGREKAIAFPTDARLYHKIRNVFVQCAKERDIALNQSYEQLGRKALLAGSGFNIRKLRRAFLSPILEWLFAMNICQNRHSWFFPALTMAART